jgi:hypothetical protein
MGCRCRLHRRHDRLPIRPRLTGDGHEVVHPEDGSDATGREHVLGESVADRSISAGHVERRRKGCVQGELGGVGIGCRRRRSTGHGSIVKRRRDHNPGEEAATLDRLSVGWFTLGVAVGGRPTTTSRRAGTCRPAIVATPLTKRRRARSRAESTRIWTPMWWRRSTRTAVSLVSPRSRRLARATAGCRAAGRIRNDRPDRCRGHRCLWRRSCSPSAQPRCRGDRGRPPEPSAAPSTGQVRQHRRHRCGPGGPVGPGKRRGQDGGTAT